MPIATNVPGRTVRVPPAPRRCPPPIEGARPDAVRDRRVASSRRAVSRHSREGREVGTGAPAFLAIDVRERRRRELGRNKQPSTGIELTDPAFAGKDVGGLNDPEQLLQLHLEPGPCDLGPRLAMVGKVPRVGEVASLRSEPVLPPERRQDGVVDGRPSDVMGRVAGFSPVQPTLHSGACRPPSRLWFRLTITVR